MSTKLKKNDKVFVKTGVDKGKEGRILKLFVDENKAIVEGVNFVNKAVRRSQDNPRGGFVKKESPVSLSNLMYACGKCNKATRIGMKILADGKKVKYCKKCDTEIGG